MKSGPIVDSVTTLEAVQHALKSKDDDQIAAAESILSALVLVLRHRRVRLPEEMRPYLETLDVK